MKKILSIFLIFFMIGHISAQVNKRVVYLWDVTYSMHGGYFAPFSVKGNVIIGGKNCHIDGYNKEYDIYDKIVDALVTDIEGQNEQTELVVIPFGSRVINSWREIATEDGKVRLINNIRNFCDISAANTQKTSISGALEYARNNIFTAEVPNVLKLLTDGKENDNQPKFHHILDNWCEFAEERNIQGYYFVLSEEALKGNSDLRNRLERNCFTVIFQMDEVVLSVNKSYITITPDKLICLVTEDYDKPLVLQVNFEAGSPYANSKVRFVSDENPYLSIDEVKEVNSNTKELRLFCNYKMSLAEIRRQMPSGGSVLIPIKFSLAEDNDDIQLQSESCTLEIINKKMKTIEIKINVK